MGLATQEVMKLPGVDLQFIMEVLLMYLLATLRIGAFLLSSPIFGARWLPLQVRIVMAFTRCRSPARRRQSMWRS